MVFGMEDLAEYERRLCGYPDGYPDGYLKEAEKEGIADLFPHCTLRVAVHGDWRKAPQAPAAVDYEVGIRAWASGRKAP